MRGPKKSRKAASRKDLFAVIGIFVYLCSLIFRILLQFIIGEKGISYFSIASEIYFLSGCVLATGLSEAVTVLVRSASGESSLKMRTECCGERCFLG